MAKTAKQKQRTKAKKRNNRGGRRGLAGVYDKKVECESTGSGILSFSSPGDIDITKRRRKQLMNDIKIIVQKSRGKALLSQESRGNLADYLGTSGHSFMDLVRFNGISSTSEIADIIINVRLQHGLATRKGHVVEEIAASLPLSGSQQWLRLDSRPALKDKICETLGPNILKQLDLVRGA